MHIDESLAQGFGDFSKIKAGFSMGGEEKDFRQKRGIGENAITPSIGGLLVAGSLSCFFKSEIVLKDGIHGRKGREL